MTKKEEFFDNLYEHSQAKLSILDKYLTSWIRKVTLGVNGKCLIIDSFAGTGFYENGDKGSPIILIERVQEFILQAENNKMKLEKIILIFIEKDVNNFKKLKESVEKLLDCKIEDGKFNVFGKMIIALTNDSHENFVSNVINKINISIPALIFVDPFGYKTISMDGMANILSKNYNFEIIINFMYEDFNRFIINNDKNLTNTQQIFYGENLEKVKKMIVGKNAEERRNIIIQNYCDNLKNAGAEYTLDFDIEKNGKVKMNIIFATKNANGFDLMKETMIKVADNSEFIYHTRKNQLTLFDLKNYTEPELIKSLYLDIQKKYINCEINIRNLIEMVKKHPRIPSKYTKKALSVLEQNGNIKNIYKLDGSLRRKNTFPDDAIIVFK